MSNKKTNAKKDDSHLYIGADAPFDFLDLFLHRPTSNEKKSREVEPKQNESTHRKSVK